MLMWMIVYDCHEVLSEAPRIGSPGFMSIMKNTIINNT